MDVNASCRSVFRWLTARLEFSGLDTEAGQQGKRFFFVRNGVLW